MNNKAFTLIELLIVIAIAAIIAGALIPLFNTSKQDAKIAKFLTLVDALRTACEQHYFDTGDYAKEYGNELTNCPRPNRELSCDRGLSGWNGPYISHPLTVDDFPSSDQMWLQDVLNNYDIDCDGDTELRGNGNDLICGDIPETIAKKINDIIDGGKDVLDWKNRGKVRYSSVIKSLEIHLYGGVITEP